MVKPYVLGSSEIGVPHTRAVAYATVMDTGWTRRDSGATETESTAGRWLDVKQAAEELRLSSDAVRKRVARGTLRSDKGEDGTVRVWLDTADARRDDDQPHDQPSGGTEAGRRLDDRLDELLLDAKDDALRDLRDQLEHMRRESERKDAIIMQMAQANASLAARVPELEASSEPRNGHEKASENKDRGEMHPEPQEPSQRRSWLHRFFFGP